MTGVATSHAGKPRHDSV